MSDRADSLRVHAARMLIRTETEEAFAQILLDTFHKRERHRDARDMAFLKELVTGTLRWQRRLDAMLDHCSTTPVAKLDAPTRTLLRLGAYQLLHMDRVPQSAAVNETVEAGKAVHPRSSGVVNAVLRRLAREKDTLSPAKSNADWLTRAGVETSHPDAIVRVARELWGEPGAERWLAANNRRAPLTLRANTLRTTREALLAALRAQGMAVRPTAVSPDGIHVDGLGGAPLDFASGLYVAQDESAQMVSRLLDPRPGMDVLEVGAAPGGKTSHIAALMQGEGTLTAVDRHEGRMGRLRANLEPLGVMPVKTLTRDMARDSNFLGEAQFDRILLDVPCSGLGTLRRQPEKKWNFDPASLAELVALQRAILTNAARHLKPGGRLVYATCTVLREENEAAVDAFLQAHPAFHRIPIEPPTLPPEWLNERGEMSTALAPVNGAADELCEADGFFAAVLGRGGGGLSFTN